MSITTPAAPARTTWQFDASHGEFGFAVRHLMISTVKGRFGQFQGEVSVENGDFATATVQLSIDAASIDTREPRRDAHLRSTDFFDAERFPTLTFSSTSVRPHGGGRYTVTGDLTIHGVTRPVALEVASEGTVRDPWGHERAGFNARGVIKRSDFGLTWNQALETGGVVVGDDVKLVIEAELIKQAERAAA